MVLRTDYGPLFLPRIFFVWPFQRDDFSGKSVYIFEVFDFVHYFCLVERKFDAYFVFLLCFPTSVGYFICIVEIHV